MSKICGYSCEHNKSGVCQISVCDKKPIMSDKAEVQTFTRYIDTTITELQQENKQLKEQLLVTQTNEETFRLEMEDITRALGLAEDTLFDDVKAYARSLKENIACNWKDSCLENAGKIEILENQQKEFISYLENCINELKKESMNELQNAINLGIVDITKEILSKYKEIIGASDENNIK